MRIAGPTTTAFLAGMPAGSSAVGVRMRPGGAPALLGLRAEALLDAAPAADAALGGGRPAR